MHLNKANKERLNTVIKRLQNLEDTMNTLSDGDKAKVKYFVNTWVLPELELLRDNAPVKSWE